MPQIFARTGLLLAALLFMLELGCGTSEQRKPTASAAGSADLAAEETNDPSLTPVTLQLNWFPEAEHGGYYAALAHGYYKEAGLNVKILPGGPDTPVVQQVARGTVDFGVVNADNILFGRAQQAPIVAVMAPLQISPRCILVHESSDIYDLHDLRDVTLAVSSSNSFTQYLRHELKLPGVKIVPYSGNVTHFLLNKNYAQQGYVFSEPFVARKGGGDPRVLMLSDVGFNPYTSTLFTNDNEVRDKPEIVEKMVNASIRGWQTYLRTPEKANAAIHKANPQMDLDILAYGAKTLEPLVYDQVAEQEGLGTMSGARWQKLADQLVKSKQMKQENADVRGAYTTRFVRKMR
jgi:NitT/TauT family transport system substrate-binding protein